MGHHRKQDSMRSLLWLIPASGLLISSCQREYMESPEDIPTSTIEFTDITSSCDSACMYDSIVLHANARGENLKYEWQRAKGSLVQDKEDPSKAYFWGCFTCVGRLTVSCTVSNEFGSFTKEIDVFVWPWTKDRGRFKGWERYIDRYGQW